MKYISTRLNSKKLSFLEVVMEGLASDGGLYVPESLPFFDAQKLQEWRGKSYEELFFAVTKDFIGDEIAPEIYQEIIAKSYRNFSHKAVAPLKQFYANEFFLELFHGPTLAFKDFALQFLGNLLDFILAQKNEKIAIIGATSGDTGSAAINGCASCKNVRIFILHPHQKISSIQRKQMTATGFDNVFNLAVEGNFDDCQSMVKQIFAARDFLPNYKIVAINSINFARIMAQIVYYFYASLRLATSSANAISFSVPTGNFGDIYAGYLAKKMGAPIKKLIIATNANNILERFINHNDYSKKQVVETISPSMNIQVASNFERLLFDVSEGGVARLMQDFVENSVLKIDDVTLAKIRKTFSAYVVSDIETKKTITQIYNDTLESVDPHSAVAIASAKKFMRSDDYQGEIIVSLGTAHIAKFLESVEGCGIPQIKQPKQLQEIEKNAEKFDILENDLEKIKKFIYENSP